VAAREESLLPAGMVLLRVAITRYRLIRELVIDLEPGTTVLIGENASGKSSVLALLDRVLGIGRAPDDPIVSAGDLHGLPAADAARDAVSMTLTFAATEPDGAPVPAAMRPLLELSGDGDDAAQSDADSRRRFVRLRVTAHPEDRPAGHFELVDADGKAIEGAPVGRDLAAKFRASFPVIRLRADRRLHAGLGLDASGALRGLERTIVDAARRIADEPERAHADGEADAVTAARRLLRLHLRSSAGAMREGSEEVAASGDEARSQGVAEAMARVGSGAGSLLLVLLLGELLHARGPHAMAPDARPIVLIEEAEAHLHPIALAGIWGLIESLAAQRIVTTNSGELLSWTPLRALRRMMRSGDGVRVCSAAGGRFDAEELRKIGHHVSRSRATAFFARVWLLVEGETEVWLLPELARRRGIEFSREGIRCLEFAQCGAAPLIRLADHLGIEWHLLADGDQAGRGYADTARGMLRGRAASEQITQLREPDVELCLWDHGYEDVFLRHAGMTTRKRNPPGTVIAAAVRASSKPALAIAVAEASMAEDAPGIPPVLEAVIGKTLRKARAHAGTGGASTGI